MERESERKREKKRRCEIGRERAEKRQSEKERGPGAGPPGLLLREGGSSESIRTVSPADTHPRPPHPPTPSQSSTPSPRSSPRSWHPYRPTYHLQRCSSVFSPFSFYYREVEEWVGRPWRRERPSLFLSYPPPRPPLSPPASPFVSSILQGRSYDLHPSCLAEFPLSLPLTLSCPLLSPTDVRARPFGNESRFQRCLSTSSYSYHPPCPPYRRVPSIRRPSSALARLCIFFLRDISAVFYRSRLSGRGNS